MLLKHAHFLEKREVLRNLAKSALLSPKQAMHSSGSPSSLLVNKDMSIILKPKASHHTYRTRAQISRTLS